MPLLLKDMSPDRPDRIFRHPMHQRVVGDLAELIGGLRQCRTSADFFHFQQDLLARVLVVQEHRAACRRVVKRLRRGSAVPVDAPELQADGSPNSVDTWELEVDVCERVDRQLRSVADALAWRVFNYDRSVIIALSRNQHPGPMVPEKKGMAAERDFVLNSWRELGRFVLLHDLTTCLRIGDATSFTEIGDEYEAYLCEVKSGHGRTRAEQVRRHEMAEEAVRAGGPLPGPRPGHIVRLDIPYRTHLDLLRVAFGLAQERAIQGMKVPGGRALVVSEIVRGYQRWPEQEFIDRTAIEHLQAVKRARVLDSAHLLYVRSDDSVARSPTAPPWAIYPLPPEVCARLITDYAMYIVTIASEAILAALGEVGLEAEWILSRDREVVQAHDVVLRAHNGIQAVELRWFEVHGRLLLEMADLDTWAEGVKEMLQHRKTGPHPWQSFAEEWKVWA